MNDFGYTTDDAGNIIHDTAQVYPSVYLGFNNYIGPFCCIGADPEKKGAKENYSVEIGNNNTFTGHVTIDGGSERRTVIGDDCYFMKHAHVGHDSIVGNGVTIAPSVCISGFVEIMEGVNIGPNTFVHQRHLLGAYAMIGGGSAIPLSKEIKPFGVYAGVAKFIGWNQVGIERAKLTDEQVTELNTQYKLCKQKQ
jgi:UDP-N-acetylglucosamine acyltransferase